jgi:hypothetical protein
VQKWHDTDNTASETRKRRYSTENSEGTDVQDERLEGARMQNRNKGLRHMTAAASQDREDIRGNRQEDFRIGVSEESNRDVLQVAEGERLGSV